MSTFMAHYAVPAAIIAVAIVLCLGLVNMAVIMATIWLLGR